MAFNLEREPDPCLVVVEPLAEALASFLDDWNLNHPQIAGQWGLDPNAPIPLRGTEWLAENADVDEDLVRSIRRRAVAVVELGVFDRLIAAMDCPQLMHDPRVTIMDRSERLEERAREELEIEQRRDAGKRSLLAVLVVRHDLSVAQVAA